MSPNRKTKKLDMLNGPIWNKLPQYAIPVAATGILEQLFNASDLSIVGNFASTDRTVAIAAVGANSSVIGVILNLFIGLSLGSNVVIANAIGRGDKKQVEQAVLRCGILPGRTAGCPAWRIMCRKPVPAAAHPR